MEIEYVQDRRESDNYIFQRYPFLADSSSMLEGMGLWLDYTTETQLCSHLLLPLLLLEGGMIP